MTVYPRVCGGTRRPRRGTRRGGGLSPRVRGNLGVLFVSPSGSRSIPACAGEPAENCGCEKYAGVYPRVCGGTISTPSAAIFYPGLSPRVRGNRGYDGGLWGYRRSIPACAGEPFSSRKSSALSTVYPRVCGGTMVGAEAWTGEWGLSPRVRGNRPRGGKDMGCKRSIPACAGEPGRFVLRFYTEWVYPRVCGGTWRIFSRAFSIRGLSPRVRGNRIRLPHCPTFGRSIPACAGEPPVNPGSWKLLSVYPRVCGGTSGGKDSTALYLGLSPRVRGNRKSVRLLLKTAGSIPACAGEP